MQIYYGIKNSLTLADVFVNGKLHFMVKYS